VSVAAGVSVLAKLEGSVGSANVRTEPNELLRFAIDGVTPKFAVRPETAEKAAEVVRTAVHEKFAVVACGARTALAIGTPPASYDVALDMTRITGISSYDPGDLTISVNAGMPLADLARELAEQKQFLPLEVPFFEKATVGGAIAAGLDSPLRQFYGTPRDFLIGAEFVDGTGAQAKSGGRVVKNVTGYDFHKLLNGSLGTLGVITRLNFRTYPIAPARRGFLASFADEVGALKFAKHIGASALTPIVLEMASPESAGLLFSQYAPFASLCAAQDKREWTVCVGFEGSGEVCERYAKELARMAKQAGAQNAVAMHDDQFAALLEILREAPVTMRDAAAEAVVMRFTALPSQLADLLRAVRSFAGSSYLTAPVLARSECIIYMALLPRAGDETAFKQLDYFWKSVGSLRGKLEFKGTMVFCPAKWKALLDGWEHANVELEMERRVKKAFDPNGVFARGRFVGGM
jgi:glycolate oxidase FAD binding subunit